jgi:hypothetical protein
MDKNKFYIFTTLKKQIDKPFPPYIVKNGGKTKTNP